MPQEPIDKDWRNCDYEIKEQDRYLPIANVGRVMKLALPEHAKLSKESKECIQECVSEFISFVTSQAADKCKLEKRKTLNGEDILWAMYTLGFENYSELLKIYLAKYRQHELEESIRKPPKKKPSKKPRKERYLETEPDEEEDEDNESLLVPAQNPQQPQYYTTQDEEMYTDENYTSEGISPTLPYPPPTQPIPTGVYHPEVPTRSYAEYESQFPNPETAYIDQDNIANLRSKIEAPGTDYVDYLNPNLSSVSQSSVIQQLSTILPRLSNSIEYLLAGPSDLLQEQQRQIQQDVLGNGGGGSTGSSESNLMDQYVNRL